jgi:hypothetical protein
MKKIVFLSFFFIFLAACTTTKITGAWKNPKQEKTYSGVFVAALTSNTIARATIENDLVEMLEKQSIHSYKSMDEFPPGIQKDSLTKEDILSRMKKNKSEAILTVSLIRKETETRYIPNDGYPYTPFHYPYYGDLWGYYSYWYPYLYGPGYYETDKIYFIETNLYDCYTEQLVWSAQSRTYNPADLQAFSKEFSKIIVNKLKDDGMLKAASDLSSKK